MTVKPLTHIEVKNARARDQDYSIFDGFGLLLYVSRTGSKSWRFRYTHPITNKRQTYTIGGYPQFSLAEAREEREKLRRQVSRGIDPGDVKKERIAEKRRQKALTVSVIAEKWLLMRDPDSREGTKKANRQMISNINKLFGHESVNNLTASGVVSRLESYADRAALRERIISCLNYIMEYGVNSGLVNSNPLAKIQRAFPAVRRTPHPSLSKNELPEFMTFWNKIAGLPTMKLALKFQIATIVRPSEAREITWSELDLVNRLWHIPGERMKVGRPHTVPLSNYALGILNEAKHYKISGSDFVFVSTVNPGKAFSRSSITNRITESEFNRRIVPHGFRSLASTVLNEEGFHPDVIEAALAHKSGDSTRDIYNRTNYLEKRRVLMEWWGDFLAAAERGEILETTGDKGLRLIG